MELQKSQIQISLKSEEIIGLIDDAKNINNIIGAKASPSYYSELNVLCCEIIGMNYIVSSFALEVNTAILKLDFKKIKKIYNQFKEIDDSEDEIDFVFFLQIFDIVTVK